jgi:ribonuclease HI
LIDRSHPWGFFDGASQDEGTKCGVGYVLFFTDEHFFEGKSYLGPGSNNFGELEAMFLLLKAAKKKGCNYIQVFGDSELVIQWMKGENQIQKSGLYNVEILLKEFASTFDQISFSHVYKQFNSQVDALSKASLNGDLLQVIEEETKNGTVVSLKSFPNFEA